MSRTQDPEQRVIDLIDLACDGRLSLEGGEELNALLKEDFLHYQTCVQYLDMHAELIQLAIEPVTAEDLAAAIQRGVPREEHRRLQQMFLASLAVAACLLAAVIGLLLMNWGEPGGPQLADVAPVAVPLGTLREVSTGVQWGSPPRRVGETLYAGDRVELQDGRALFEFPTGVQVRFQGPGALTVESGMALRLESGRLLAQVPQAGHGFTVRAAGTTIVDHGTEFLVDVVGELAASVAVREGRVGVGFGENPAGSGAVIVHGGAAIFADGRQRLFTPVDLDSKLFLPFDFDIARIQQVSGQLRYVVEPEPPFSALMGVPASHAILVRERAAARLPAPLSVDEPFGQYNVPEGALVDSFLIHYSPDDKAVGRINGSVTFQQPVLAVCGLAGGLNELDQILEIGFEGEVNGSRGLDPDSADTVRLSEDRRTVSFSMVTARGYSDQIRILVETVLDK